MSRLSWNDHVSYIGSCRIPNGTIGGVTDGYGYTTQAACLDDTTLWLTSKSPGNYIGRLTLPLGSLNSSYVYASLPWATHEEWVPIPAAALAQPSGYSLGVAKYNATHLILNRAREYSEIYDSAHMCLMAIDGVSSDYPAGGLWRVDSFNMHRAAGQIAKHPASVSSMLGHGFSCGMSYTVSRSGSYGNAGSSLYGFTIDTGVPAGGSLSATRYIEHDSLTNDGMPMGWVNVHGATWTTGYKSQVDTHQGGMAIMDFGGEQAAFFAMNAAHSVNQYRNATQTHNCGLASSGYTAGYWCPHIYAYDIADLAAVAAGVLPHNKLMWYERVFLPQYLMSFRNYKSTPCAHWNQQTGTARHVYAMAADENRIVLIERMNWMSDGYSPIVHVFELS